MILATAMLIDDDSFVRTTLQAGLAHYGIQVSDSLESASAAIKAIAESNADVAIVDLDLGPGPSGIDVCHTLRTHKPNLGLILLTSYQDPRIFDPSSSNLPKGCRFISKSELTDFNLLVQTILSARMKPFHSKAEGSSDSSTLTATQLEVLKLVAEGLSTDEIAKIREVSPKAIESSIAKIHKAAGFKKSKAMNQRVQLARFYFLLSGKKPPGA
ncbi:CitB Response regulator containing a CheY-like receiver domain and an HTH DNA-binding domain [Candidatus Nanopelagicaceae bacterium]